jgi:hypothetical protein
MKHMKAWSKPKHNHQTNQPAARSLQPAARSLFVSTSPHITAAAEH